MLFGLLLGLLSARYAKKKGYNYYWWFLSLGLIGLITIILLPNLDKYPENLKAKKKLIGDSIGSIFTLLSLFFTILSIAMKSH